VIPLANKYCPICEEENECMAGMGEDGNCWCDKETFPSEILQLFRKKAEENIAFVKNA